MIDFHIYISEFWAGFAVGVNLMYALYRLPDFIHFMNSPYKEGELFKFLRNKRGN